MDLAKESVMKEGVKKWLNVKTVLKSSVFIGSQFFVISSLINENEKQTLAINAQKRSASEPAKTSVDKSVPSKNSIFSHDFFKSKPNAVNIFSGGSAGFSTGLIIGAWEAAKVKSQTGQSVKLKHLVSPEFYKSAIKPATLFTFSFLFGGVCALEFSVNDYIKKNYGPWNGMAASSVTGAVFLTVADHIMYRQYETKQSPGVVVKNLFKQGLTVPWTGFSSMVVREGFWISSVMHFGPSAGDHLRVLFNGDEHNSQYWDGVGRTTTGMVTGVLSQPFDVIARTMQQSLAVKPDEKPSFSSAVRQLANKCQSENTVRHFYRGGLPRLGLATAGGVLAGGFFDTYKKTLTGMRTESAVLHKELALKA